MAYTAYFATALTGGASGALDAIDGTALINNDIAMAVLGGITRIYRLDDNSAMTEASPYIITPDTNAGNKRWILQPMWGENHISGLVLSNGTNADHDIDISTGSCFDSTNTTGMFLTSVLTKQIDVAWAVGNAGGMFTGTVANDTIYHKFLIKRSDTGVVDAGFDTSATAANKPANYDYYRWLGWVKTAPAATTIIPGNWIGNSNQLEFWFKARYSLATGLNQTSYTAQATTGAIPSGIVSDALFGVTGTADAGGVWLSSDGTNAKTIFSAINTSSAVGGRNELYYAQFGSSTFIPIIANQIYYKVGGSTIALYLRAVRYWR